ncbi:MAG: M56 family metallopeptidase, partial [Lachnospiraceae bacterium]|nr:M56 family metallopeptidase [Lachnospiraceae bacterium]
MNNPTAEVAITYSGIGNDNFPQSADDISETKPAHRIPENTVQALCILWLVAALLLFVRKITVYQSFVKYVIAGSKPVDDIILLERFGQIMAENHIKGTVELCVNDLVSSPLLIGFTHAHVILPTINLSEDDFYYTVLHELIHYKRRDMFYKWLVQLTICLHWFNPFAYLMGREINRTCELSCDERVIATLSDKSRKSYGDTLLNAIGTGGSYQDTLASVTLNESKELLKGRLEAIMKYKKIPKAVQTVAVFITGILVGGAAVLGAYAAPTAKSSTDRITLTDTTISSDGEKTNSTIDSSDSQTAADTGNTAAQNSNALSHTQDYIIEYEDGTFYILTGGATEADKPSSVVTNGYSCLVLVRKDEYHSFGSWRDREMQNLVRHITPQCQTSLENGRMTQEDMDIVIAAATEIQEAYRSGDDIQEIYRPGDNDSVTDDSVTGDSVTLYNYTQAAYYQAPYIIEIGYNL